MCSEIAVHTSQRQAAARHFIPSPRAAAAGSSQTTAMGHGNARQISTPSLAGGGTPWGGENTTWFTSSGSAATGQCTDSSVPDRGGDESQTAGGSMWRPWHAQTGAKTRCFVTQTTLGQFCAAKLVHIAMDRRDLRLSAGNSVSTARVPVSQQPHRAGISRLPVPLTDWNTGLRGSGRWRIR